ncbi:hypothetical protein HJG60_008908 [Phyllostomus discolor]|uniref:Uncharacterized protein n=1 Tax=Phyllostomus discolor TaxID=89673 RepID=A0A833YZS3_9CHIR|nr:hypothetical protein HJG60_008908 [Phyllostomus discolor]
MSNGNHGGREGQSVLRPALTRSRIRSVADPCPNKAGRFRNWLPPPLPLLKPDFLPESPSTCSSLKAPILPPRSWWKFLPRQARRVWVCPAASPPPAPPPCRGGSHCSDQMQVLGERRTVLFLH